VGVECNHSWNLQGLTRNYREHKVSLWSGTERLMFPDCSLVFGSHLKHSMVENSPTLLRKCRLKSKNLAARMASRSNIANMLDPKLVVRLEASFGGLCSASSESLRVWMFTNHFYGNPATQESVRSLPDTSSRTSCCPRRFVRCKTRSSSSTTGAPSST
jgi:hypothetical protein